MLINWKPGIEVMRKTLFVSMLFLVLSGQAMASAVPSRTKQESMQWCALYLLAATRAWELGQYSATHRLKQISAAPQTIQAPFFASMHALWNQSSNKEVKDSTKILTFYAVKSYQGAPLSAVAYNVIRNNCPSSQRSGLKYPWK